MMIKDILEGNGFEVIGEADNGLKAVELYKKDRPDIVTMHITYARNGWNSSVKRNYRI